MKPEIPSVNLETPRGNLNRPIDAWGSLDPATRILIIASLMASTGFAGYLNWKLFEINSRVDNIATQIHEIGTQVGEIGDHIGAIDTDVAEMLGTPTP